MASEYDIDQMGGDVDVPLHTFLVVDDDPESIAATKGLLESCGFHVNTANSGGQAYSVVTREKPDFIILKIILPGESGFEICERLKQQDNKIPIMMFTEIDLALSLNLAQRIGADGYIVRPCDKETFLDTIQQITKVVWLQNQEEVSEDGLIRFKCKCGAKIKERFANRNKFTTCNDCQQRLMVPTCSDKAFITHVPPVNESTATGLADPLKHVTVKCQHCGTYYYLWPEDLAKARTCPRCKKEQDGTLSIVGAPLSRAALESSMRVLRIKSGKMKGKKILLPAKEVRVGRSKQCQIRFTIPSISDNHCSLKPSKRGVIVKDLGSERGTMIDGQKIDKPSLLGPGQILQVGPLKFQLTGHAPQQMKDMDKRLEQWMVEEEKAREQGVSVYQRTASTTDEAAKVIKLHWEVVRSRELQAQQKQRN